MKMKRKLLFSFIFIASISSILVSTSCRIGTNNDVSNYPEIPNISPNDPNKPITPIPPTEPEKPPVTIPITPPTEPEKPPVTIPVTPPTEPEKPPVDPKPIDPTIEKIYFKNSIDLENKLNELYRNKLKKDLIEIIKSDFEKDFPGCTITSLPERINLSNVKFEQTIEQNTYILTEINDLTFMVIPVGELSFSAKSNIKDHNLNIYFIKQ